MLINQYGQVTISEQEAFAALYSGKLELLKNIFLDSETTVNAYNSALTANADELPKLSTYKESQNSPKEFDANNQKSWFMPKEYLTFDIASWLFSQCATQEETDRVSEELELFVQFNMIEILCYLKYLVDTMRTKNIVWGVGRGSSVASYCLYLIGIHRINSLKYNLEIREFLK